MKESAQPIRLDISNRRRAAAMLASGLDSKEAVLAAGVEGLQAVSGIGEKKATGIIGYLSQ